MMHAVDKRIEREWRLLAKQWTQEKEATGKREASRALTGWEQPQTKHRLLWRRVAEHWEQPFVQPIHRYSKEDPGLHFWELRCIFYHQDCTWKDSVSLCSYKRQYVCHTPRSVLGHLCEAQSNCTCYLVTAEMHCHHAPHVLWICY